MQEQKNNRETVIPNRSTVLYLHRFCFHKSTEERRGGKKKVHPYCFLKLKITTKWEKSKLFPRTTRGKKSHRAFEKDSKWHKMESETERELWSPRLDPKFGPRWNQCGLNGKHLLERACPIYNCSIAGCEGYSFGYPYILHLHLLPPLKTLFQI